MNDIRNKALEDAAQIIENNFDTGGRKQMRLKELYARDLSMADAVRILKSTPVEGEPNNMTGVVEQSGTTRVDTSVQTGAPVANFQDVEGEPVAAESTFKWIKHPIRYDPVGHNDGPSIFDADGNLVAALFWPLHPVSDTEAAENELHRVGQLMALRSNNEAEEAEAYEIGKRDGYEDAVQEIDVKTGGDGEFYGSTIPGRGVDVPAMLKNIVERYTHPVATNADPVQMPSADLIDRKALLKKLCDERDDYAREHLSSDPETGAYEGSRSKEEYLSTLEEHIEVIEQFPLYTHPVTPRAGPEQNQHQRPVAYVRYLLSQQPEIWNTYTIPPAELGYVPVYLHPVTPRDDYQERVAEWMDTCFGHDISADVTERNHRFLEEAIELVQSLGCSQSDAHALVDYVYNRPQGDVNQEVGGVMVTLAALCNANGIDMDGNAESELARVWTKIENIRAKQAAKPKGSPLHPVTAKGEL